MKLSFIVPMYNAEGHLRRCLRSLQRQGFAPGEAEVLLVDDGSTDGTLALAEGFRAAMPEVRILRSDRRGPGGARNLALAEARGDWVWFVDIDDYLADGAASRAVGLMEANHLDILTLDVLSRAADVEAPDTAFGAADTALSPTVDGRAYVEARNFRFEVWSYIASTALLRQAGPMLEKRFCADNIFTPKLFLLAHRIAHLPGPAYAYVHRESSVTCRGDVDHLRRMVDDMCHVAAQLRELAEAEAARGSSVGLVRRLRSRAEALGFFLLMRLHRRGAPVVMIKDARRRLCHDRILPIRDFGAPEYPGLGYVALRTLINSAPLHRIMTTAFRLYGRLRYRS